MLHPLSEHLQVSISHHHIHLKYQDIIALCGSWGKQAQKLWFPQDHTIFWENKESSFCYLGENTNYHSPFLTCFLTCFLIFSCFHVHLPQKWHKMVFLEGKRSYGTKRQSWAYPCMVLNCLLCVREKPAGFETCTADATV